MADGKGTGEKALWEAIRNSVSDCVFEEANVEAEMPGSSGWKEASGVMT